MLPERLLSHAFRKPSPTRAERLVLRALDTLLDEDPGLEDFIPRKPKGMVVFKN